MRVVFDSRPASGEHGAGLYARRLLAALRETAADDDELLETHRPLALARSSRSADVFHSPWMDGAQLHCPCPMVVTLNDLSAVKRRSERLRCGGLHVRMRRLALQRAAHVIVPADDLAAEAIAELGLQRSRVVVVPASADWHELARATWRVYARASAAAR